MSKITIEQIQAMNENEWQEFRQMKWDQYRKKYSGDAPANFMADQNKYADYIDKYKHKK